MSQVTYIQKDKPEDPVYFTNYYRCSNCGNEWEDDWSCACDDECSNCGTDMTPYFSDDGSAEQEAYDKAYARVLELHAESAATTEVTA